MVLGLTGLEKYHVQNRDKKAAVNSMVKNYGIKRLTATKMVNEYWRDVFSY